MSWFRTIHRFIRLLVAIFLAAQFAGVVSSPRADARTVADTALSQANHLGDHHDHADGGTHRHGGGKHGDGGGNPADTCCALHAYFAGVLPQAVTMETVSQVGTRLAANLDDREIGVSPGRLDRPPRPLR